MFCRQASFVMDATTILPGKSKDRFLSPGTFSNFDQGSNYQTKEGACRPSGLFSQRRE